MAAANVTPERVKRIRLPRPADNKCIVCGESPVHAKSLCSRHYRRLKRTGDPLRITFQQQNSKCSHQGCGSPARACGFCRKHYLLEARSGSLGEDRFFRSHPLYGLWWARRQSDQLSLEWRNDFRRFITDVGERPGKFFNLVKISDGPFGPDNFRWREQIKQRPGESRRAFHARKWQTQNVGRPGWQKVRGLKRKYGITTAQYEQMLEHQNGVCAICLRPETKLDHRLGTVKRLAVDHNHRTGKVRALLCERCNLAIGKIEESVDILRAMITYLQKHQTESHL